MFLALIDPSEYPVNNNPLKYMKDQTAKLKPLIQILQNQLQLSVALQAQYMQGSLPFLDLYQ